jgi:Potential Queuosine, Q, salvage protein family
MADDGVDPELVELLRASLFGKDAAGPVDPDTRVLRDAEFIYNNSIDVAIDSLSTKQATAYIWKTMLEQKYSAKTWSAHELHPKEKTDATVAFIFTMDLLNFSFWQDDPKAEPFTVEYKGTSWTGYWSLVAALQRAIDEGSSFLSRMKMQLRRL